MQATGGGTESLVMIMERRPHAARARLRLRRMVGVSLSSYDLRALEGFQVEAATTA